MSENQIQNRIIEGLKKAEATEDISSEKVYEIFRDTIYDAVKENTDKADELKPIVKNAVIAAAKSFHDEKEDGGKREKENIASAVKGIMAGIKLCKDKSLDAMRAEIKDLEEKIRLEEKKLAGFLKIGIEGVSEAENVLPEEIKTNFESIVSDIRSNFTRSSEFSGVYVQGVKDAVKQAIKSGGDIKEAVKNITRDATKKALKEGRLKSGLIKETTEKILSGAVDAAEEMGKDIKEVTGGAFKGIQQGITSMAGSISDNAKEFVSEDLSETKEDLKTIKTLFLETVLKVGKRSGEVARKVLDDLADQSKATGTAFKEETGSAADRLTGRLKNLGKEAVKTFGNTGEKAARMVTGEVKEIGKKSINIAKGSITGMWKGAKEALEKDLEKDKDE